MRWIQLTEVQAMQLTNCTNTPGFAYEVPVSALPSGPQKMPNITAVFVSGYITSMPHIDGLNCVGAVTVLRQDANTNKAYVFYLGVANDGTAYYSGPYKDFPEHYYRDESKVPIEHIFAHTISHETRPRKPYINEPGEDPHVN